jgi:glycosyltransferase involved in cell wall biosynthesis
MTAPRGAIDLIDGTSRFGGWVLFEAEQTARVEISVDGRWIGRARLGMPRPDLARAVGRSEAVLCGFEHHLDPGDLPPGAQQVTVGARALGTRGGAGALPAVTIPVDHPNGKPAAAAPAVDADDERRLRERVAAVIAASATPPVHPPNVLVFTDQLGYGGAQLYLLEMLGELTRTGVGAYTLVSSRDGPLRERFEALGIPVHITLPARGAAAYEGKLAELAAWAAPEGINSVLANTLDAFPGVDLAARLGIPAVWFVHESFDPVEWYSLAYRESADPYRLTRLRAALASAAAVVFEAEATREKFLPYASAERMVVLPCGIMLDEIDRYRQRAERDEIRRRLDIAPDASLVLCVGTIEPRKGQAALAMAFADLADSHPDAVLALVGETDWAWLDRFNQGLRRFIARAGLDSRIVVVPVTPDPYEWLAAADVLVLASDVESLPRVVLEGMAFGLPVVATSIFGVAEVIDDGRTGYLFAPRDVGELTAALERVLAGDPALRQAVAQRGAERVRQHDARRYAARVRALLQTLLANPRTLPAPALESR